jgi:hypothetical protein
MAKRQFNAMRNTYCWSLHNNRDDVPGERVRTLEREVQRLREENAMLYERLAERS